MPLGEFELIRQIFQKGTSRQDVTLGIGDDCALVTSCDQEELAITVDTLVSGIHFLESVDPESLGHKALAVNLSDLAAMGANPCWCTLALTVPEVETSWLESFARGFFNLASLHDVQLIGGDTTRGPLSITVQAIGKIKKHHSLQRNAAKPGEMIWLSGPVGTAGLGLAIRQGKSQIAEPLALEALDRPTPRVELGRELVGLASACIDVSDGLLQDLAHILGTSQCGARVQWEAIPVIPAVASFADQTGQPDFALSAGDDYELCFTASEAWSEEIQALLRRLKLKGGPIGTVVSDQGLKLFKEGKLIIPQKTGYAHF